MGADHVNGLAQGTGTMTEHSLTWIFVVGMMFSFLDAFGIGANVSECMLCEQFFDYHPWEVGIYQKVLKERRAREEGNQ